MRIALGVEYDGSGFCGWQTQPSGCAVQDHLEAALARIAGVPDITTIGTICAWRTDTGVHALAQVVHFDCMVERPESAWVRGVNALLPSTVAVTWMKPVAETFHARFSALARHYRYVLLNHAVRPAADAGRVGWFHVPLDIGRMRAAAASLLGEQDFTAFRSSQCQAKSPVRTLDRLDVAQVGEEIHLTVSARSFLHSQVRSMVGSLVWVGEGRWSADDLAAALEARRRSACGIVAPPEGLYLMQVDY